MIAGMFESLNFEKKLLCLHEFQHYFHCVNPYVQNTVVASKHMLMFPYIFCGYLKGISGNNIKKGHRVWRVHFSEAVFPDLRAANHMLSSLYYRQAAHYHDQHPALASARRRY